MENKRKRNIIYALLFVAVLLVNVLVIVIFHDHAAITKYSILSLVFAFCSIVNAIIAISFREYFNLFFLNLYIVAKIFNKSYNETQEYKEDFIKFAFIYCMSIPIYITLSLFVDSFYSGIMRPLEVSIVRDAVIIFLGYAPLAMKNIVRKKQQYNEDETARREQERRESMGKWK